jgi:hypothetical protein
MINSRKWTGHVARVGGRRCSYRVLVGRPEGKRPLGRHRSRWEDNIKMDPQEGGSIWLRLRDSWWALVDEVMKPKVQ